MRAIVLTAVVLLTGCSSIDSGRVLIALSGDDTFYDCSFERDPICIPVETD